MMVQGSQNTPIRKSWAVQLLGFLGFLVLCFATAGLGAYFTAFSVNDWYLQINRPSWNPPGWVFPVVWNLLFFLMAVSAWLVWRAPGTWREKGRAWLAFGMQLLLNASWSALFFTWQRPDLALLDLIFLWLAIAAMIVCFYRHSRLAGLFQIPYWLWVTFAGILNFTIWQMNR